MKMHYLRYFVVLAEELHYGRAAQRLAITQPPLSSAIKALEDELGAQLLVRSSKQVDLTPAGAAFFEEARRILERIERASGLARSVAHGVHGRLEIGMASSLVFREVPSIVRDFQRTLPGIDVVLREMSTADQLQDLLHGQLHAGFINVATVPPQLMSLPLQDDAFVLCLPEQHPNAQDLSVDLAQLGDEHFVMFAREVAPANYDNVIAIFSRAGIHPETTHAARQWLTIVAMVAQGLGISIVPKSLAASGMRGVRFVPFAGFPASAPAVMVWNPAHLSAALSSLIECAAATISRTSAIETGQGRAA